VVYGPGELWVYDPIELRRQSSRKLYLYPQYLLLHITYQGIVRNTKVAIAINVYYTMQLFFTRPLKEVINELYSKLHTVGLRDFGQQLNLPDLPASYESVLPVPVRLSIRFCLRFPTTLILN